MEILPARLSGIYDRQGMYAAPHPSAWPLQPARLHTPGLDMPKPFHLLAGLETSKPSDASCSDTEWCNDRTLDFRNDQVRKGSSHPHLRLTGAQINMDLLYRNVDLGTGRAELWNKRVDAEVSRCTSHQPTLQV